MYITDYAKEAQARLYYFFMMADGLCETGAV